MRVAITTFLLVWVAHAGYARTIDQIIKDAGSDELSDEPQVYGDGSVLVEYDLRFTAEQWAKMQTEEEGDDDETRSKRKAMKDTSYRWPNGIIPYTFANNAFSSREKDIIVNAMRVWEKHVPCIKFQPVARGDYNWVYIDNVSSKGCWSYYGCIGGSQLLSLAYGCVNTATVIHELGHAIGFYHEQARPDRDDYISVHLENVASNQRYNYNKQYNSNDYGVGYDYASIMHYGQYAFSYNGKRTMTTHDSYWQTRIGTAQGPSAADVKLAKILYKC